MKLFAVISIARQIEGEYVFVKTEKGFHQASKADEYLKQLKSESVDENGKVKILRLSTPNGEVDCFREIGVTELEVDDEPAT